MEKTAKQVTEIPCLFEFLQELFRLPNAEFWNAVDMMRHDKTIMECKDRTKQDKILWGEF